MYDEVYEAERVHTIRMQELGLRSDLHNNALETLLECLGPADGSGVCYSWKTVTENLLTVKDRLSGANAATMYEYYSTTGRWREVSGKTWDEISEEEYHMLALIYLNLETPEEIQEFTWLLCDQMGPDGSYGNSQRWEMNLEKLERIQGYVEQEFSELYILYLYVNGLSSEEFKAWYKDVFGEDIANDEISIRKGDYLDEIDDILGTVQQKHNLLLALSDLESFTPDQDNYQKIPIIGRGSQGEWRLFEQGYGPGTLKNEPPITITWDEESSSYVITYEYNCYESSRFRDIQILNIEETKGKSLIVKDLKDINQAYWDNVFGTTDADTADGAIDKANSAKDAGGRAIGNVLKKSGSPLVKKIGGRIVPIIGPVVTALYEMDKESYEKGLRAIETDRLSSLFDQGGLIVQFDLKYTITKPEYGNALTKVVLYPGPETMTRLDNYNVWVEWWNKKMKADEHNEPLKAHVDEINATGKITIDDIYSRPDAIAGLSTSSGPMSPKEAELIFDSTPLTEEKLNTLLEKGIIKY